MIFEDGEQRRDFVHISDISRAFLVALDHPAAVDDVFNIGSGEVRSVTEVARALGDAMGAGDRSPEYIGKTRIGDIRHCFPDVANAEAKLGFRATKDWNEGLTELAEWVASQQADDRVAQARAELEKRGLVA